jgi:hypothetical protein
MEQSRYKSLSLLGRVTYQVETAFAKNTELTRREREIARFVTRIVIQEVLDDAGTMIKAVLSDASYNILTGMED